VILAPTLTVFGTASRTQPNAVLVSGAGTEETNGTYPQAADVNGRPSYQKGSGLESLVIQWNGSTWEIKKAASFYYEDLEQLDVAYPWLVQTWDALAAALPGPTLSPARA
jgi:hypothetical protein